MGVSVYVSVGEGGVGVRSGAFPNSWIASRGEISAFLLLEDLSYVWVPAHMRLCGRAIFASIVRFRWREIICTVSKASGSANSAVNVGVVNLDC